MKLIKHPNDCLFLVRLFIMLLLVLCIKNYIIYEQFMEWFQKNEKMPSKEHPTKSHLGKWRFPIIIKIYGKYEWFRT
jgi:hypothetical protein